MYIQLLITRLYRPSVYDVTYTGGNNVDQLKTLQNVMFKSNECLFHISDSILILTHIALWSMILKIHVNVVFRLFDNHVFST